MFQAQGLIYQNAGEQLSERFSKDRYDIKNRPANSELAKHFHESQNLSDDLNVTIVQNGSRMKVCWGQMDL